MDTTAKRREAVLSRLKTAQEPVSATALAREFSVSRQIIVGDIALLRARGEVLASTPRGYIIPNPRGGVLHTVVCRHSALDLERELLLIVDQGCTAVDVAVEHPVYGQLSGQLQIASRYDVSEFIRRVNEEDAKPLSALTGGVHLHRLQCPDEAAFRRVEAALDAAGFLVKE